MRNLNPISENSNFDCWRSNVQIISSAYESKEKFTFCIRTQVKNNFTDLQLQLNEEIQRRFQRVCYLKMSSCVNTNTKTSRWDADGLPSFRPKFVPFEFDPSKCCLISALSHFGPFSIRPFSYNETFLLREKKMLIVSDIP